MAAAMLSRGSTISRASTRMIVRCVVFAESFLPTRLSRRSRGCACPDSSPLSSSRDSALSWRTSLGGGAVCLERVEAKTL